jgi:hypothetical protein
MIALRTLVNGFLPLWPSTTSMLVLTVLISVSVRIAAALFFGDEIRDLPGVYDQVSYHVLAQQVLAGRGFTTAAAWWPATGADQPTAHWSYLYTLYVAATYAAFGAHPLAARLIQAIVVGLLHPWLAWRLSTRLFGARVGVGAAGLTAIYSYFVYYSGALMTEALYILAILWALDLTTKMILNPSATPARPAGGTRTVLSMAKPWLILGLALGIAVLLRQVILLFVPVLLAWLVWATVSSSASTHVRIAGALRQSLAGALITVAVIGALVAPWTVRNFQAFGRVVLLNTNAGYAFFWANHPIHGDDFIAILPGGVYEQLIPRDLRQLDEAALDQALLLEGTRFVLADPGRYIRLSLSRIKDFFQFWPSPESGIASNYARVLSFGVCLPLMLFGLILTVAERQSVGTRRWQAIVLLYLFIAWYTLIHLASWALVRYRLPVDAVLLPFAALALIDLAGRVLGRSGTAVPWRVVAGGQTPTTA